MTSVLILTHEQRAQLEETGEVVLFRAGECALCGPDCGCGGSIGRIDPPAEFVEWAKPCETCGGKGLVRHRYRADSDEGVCPNPDCLNGKRRVAVAVPCEQCERIRAVMRQHGLTRNDEPCDDCGQIDGFVTVGHVVVEWGPFGPLDTVDNGRILTVRGNVFVGPIYAPPGIDPATLVGKYGIGAKVVSP